MRITGGAARGHPLRVPRGLKVRPTADKLRGAIFNVLSSRDLIAERRVLDLFAGSGALGLEALSRGADHVLFVDGSRESCRAAAENARRSGFGDRVAVRRLPLPAGLRRLKGTFGGVFLDPPYRTGLASATLDRLTESGLLATDAWVVAEHSDREALADSYGALVRRLARRHGSTTISLYVAAEQEEES